jgi:hypothetical protein
VDNLPEASFRNLELVAKDPMEEVIADFRVFVVRDLGPHARPVG